jgi:site-specific DNA-cytosine methylase
MPKLKIGSLFSGYGGLDLGVMEVLDAEVAWHCEWEDAPSAILDAHWPDVPNYRDVSKVDWAAVEPVDILTGGMSPVQICEAMSSTPGAIAKAAWRVGRSDLFSMFEQVKNWERKLDRERV